MNKISKKIVSLITMAAFVLTLVPAAAFAAPATVDSYVDVSTDAVYATGTSKTADATIDVAVPAGEIGKGIVLWVQKDGQDKVYDKATYTVDNTNATVYPTNTGYPWDGTEYAVFSANSANIVKVTVHGLEVGSYKVYAAMNTDNTADTWAGLTDLRLVDNDITVDYNVDRQASSYGVIDANGDVTPSVDVKAGGEVTTTFKVLTQEGQPLTTPLNNVKIWIIDNETDKTTNIGTVSLVNADGTTTEIKPGSQNGYALTSVSNDTKVKVSFDVKGSYTLYAGIGDTVEKAQKAPLKGATTINVDVEYTVDHFAVDAVAKNIANGATYTYNNLEFDENNMATLDLTTATEFRYAGQDTVTLSGVAYQDDDTVAQFQDIEFGVTTPGVVEFTKDTVNTGVKGEFETAFTMQSKQNVMITITDKKTGVEYSIRVIADKAVPTDINRTQTGGYILAGTDSNWTDYNRLFTDAVQFEILDSKENVVTSSLKANEDYFITVRGKATGSDLTADELRLVPTGDGAYTLKYVGDTPKTDLTAGKYEVRVALPGVDGDNATVTFTAEKFGKAQDTVLDVYAADHNWTWGNPNEEIMTVDDQITLGQTVGVVAKYVDANGIKIKANDVTYGFNGGLAVVDPMPKDGFFSTPADTASNQSLLGTEIEIVAYNTAKHQLVTKTLTLVPSYTDKSLDFDPVQGPTNEDNKVTVSVVDENGKVQQVEGTLDAWVADQSNEDAKVSVDVNNKRPHDVQDGKGSLTVYSDQETTADITVVVKAGNEAYYGTLEYTFGTEDPLANRTVVMTIDSTEYVVNNNVIKGDAAPYIDSAWRTMVPIRALMEAFDSEVIWDQDAQTVTINFDADSQIVMTVGETGYTIDGVDGEMDTVPVNTGDRVYVPIRFVAEGIGFHVLPLYNADGLTASVVFQR